MDRTNNEITIWGGGGHGKVVADIARAAGYRVVGYIDADPSRMGQQAEPGGAKVRVLESEFIAAMSEGPAGPESGLVALGVGDNASRWRCRELLGSRIAPAFVHPSAVVSKTASIGFGSVVMPGAMINAAARIGEAVIINTAAVIEHDCEISDAAHVSPGAILTGGVFVGVGSWIGAGAIVLPGVRVGANAIVGAGAVVVRDVGDNETVVGVPARNMDKGNQ